MSSTNITQTCVRRLQKEYKELIKEPIPNIKIYISPDNILKWYFCFYDLDDPAYSGGEYFGLVEMDPDYPHKPPSYYMYTPNGRFAVGEKICTSNSDFHPESWKPTWVMGALFRGFLSLFLEDNSKGPLSYNHLRTSIKAKQKYAEDSHSYNEKHHKELNDAFASDQVIVFKKSPVTNSKIKIKLKNQT